MFRIVKKSTIDSLIEKNNDQFFMILQFEIKINRLEVQLKEAIEENKRLFDYHNKRLTKPKPDKNGVLRNKDGTFARKK